MKAFLLFLSGMFMVTLVSCKHNFTEETDPSGNTVIKEWYGKNRLKSVKVINGDFSDDYVYILYDKAGNMTDSARYVNDTIEGLRKYYEEKTTLFHTENYLHGFLNGLHMATYPNGINGFIGFRKNNLMVGEWEFYFMNGHPITYEYYDSTGVLKYFRKYDDEGNVLKVNGLGMIKVKSDKSLYGTNGTLSGFVEAATPPGCSTQFVLEAGSHENPLMKHLDILLEEPKTEWEIAFDDPGEKYIKYTVTITDNKTGKTEVSVSEETIKINPD